MTRISGSLLCALLAVTLLAGCSMPAPKPASTAATRPSSATPALPAVAVATPTTAPASTEAATAMAAPAQAATAAPATPEASPTPYDYASLPGWFTFVDFDCNGTCTNVSIIRPDFLQRRVLTNHTSGRVIQPVWSPGGRQIAFTFFTAGDGAHMELRMVSTKAAKEVKLVTLKAGVEFSSIGWSPDGKYVLYTAGQADKPTQIYRVNVSTIKAQKLSKSAENADADPVWSPDGKWIAFTSNRKDASGAVGAHIWLMKPDGSGVKALLTPGEEFKDWKVFKPAWSPDGKRIAFFWLPPVDLHASAGVQMARLGINAGGAWVVGADGKEPALISACGDIPTAAPVWSPDGQKIAFACGDSETLVVVGVEDGSLLKTQAAPGANYSISWSPDSKAIVYLKKTDENQRTINLFLLDGENSFTESANSMFDQVTWSPVVKLP